MMIKKAITPINSAKGLIGSLTGSPVVVVPPPVVGGGVTGLYSLIYLIDIILGSCFKMKDVVATTTTNIQPSFL